MTFAVALFLELDVRQITDTSKKSNPWQLFSGNRIDVAVLLDRAPILLGYVSSLHYVSLRPAEGVPLKLRLEDFEMIGMDATLKSIELAVKLATQYMAESLLGSVPLSCSGVSLTPGKEKSKFRLDCDICQNSTMHTCIDCKKPVCAIYCSESVGDESQFLKRHKAGDPRCRSRTVKEPTVTRAKKHLRLDEGPLDLSSPVKDTSSGQVSGQTPDTNNIRSVSFFTSQDHNLIWLLPPTQMCAEFALFDGECKTIVIQPSPYLTEARPQSLVIRVQADTSMEVVKDTHIHFRYSDMPSLTHPCQI